ncbi:TPA: hypothetical protein HA338_08900 [Methanosarcina acetivorans]|uniref:Uncharacterized protein n=2 Tax=Methanosarcina acetivorans TaxID=2214 RepID=Q8TM59_METAC|nr:hypothetical protein [Methanosarcina acetivorans]AAM06188.1 predicted protein [Methanosarcina acetivorans C2A]HIH94146.1 hypothetical protein [Methanosarcina acetivorans]
MKLTKLVFSFFLALVLLVSPGSAEDLEVWLGSYLNDFLANLLNAIFYPFRLIFYHIELFISELLSPITNLITSIYELFRLAYDLSIGFLTSFMPVEWVLLIGAGLLIRLFKAVYSYLKDVEILGFKI